MSYLDQRTSPARIWAIVVVAILHVLIGFAFITGFYQKFTKEGVQDLDVFDVTEEPPPPEEEPPPPTSRSRRCSRRSGGAAANYQRPQQQQQVQTVSAGLCAADAACEPGCSASPTRRCRHSVQTPGQAVLVPAASAFRR
jgi:hypothetical protein